MTYPSAQSLSQDFGTTHWPISKLVTGLSNKDGLVQPPFEVNCLNLVLGHILASSSFCVF